MKTAEDTAHIMVVEDEEAISEFITMFLKDEGYQVTNATDGTEALKLLQQPEFRPDLILLDMRMPEMDGLAFSQAYRKLTLPLAPIILLTAASDSSDVIGQINPSAYLAKPFDLDQLIALVENLVKK